MFKSKKISYIITIRKSGVQELVNKLYELKKYK